MPTVIAISGAANANSYLTVAEADAYFTTRLFSTNWTTATTATKETALIMATRLMDSMWQWEGAVTDDVQALLWPRVGMLDRNELEVIDDDIIPDELKNAVAELAFQLIAEDRTLDSDIESKKITSLTAGPVSLSFAEGVTAKVIPDAVYNLIPPWWGWVRGRRTGIREAWRT